MERSILRQALSMLGRNLGTALVLSLATVVVQAALIWFLAGLVQGGPPAALVTLQVLLHGLLPALILTQVGVPWHRRLLLGEGSSPLTVVRRYPEALRYFAWSALLLLCVQIALLALRRVVQATLRPLLGLLLVPLPNVLEYYAGVILFTMLPWVVVLWLLLRVSLVLPGGAIGSRLSPRQSWATTAPVARPLLGVAALGALVPAFVWSVPWFAILVSIGPKGLIVPFAMAAGGGWLALMLGLSVLTALYERLVERRSPIA